MSNDRPTTNRTTCDTPVRVEGHTTLHYEPAEPSGLTVDDIPAHPRNVQRAYRSDEFNAERERADGLAQQLQTAQAAAAALREVLMLARDWERTTDREPLRERYRDLLGGSLTTQALDAAIDKALSGDAGAAYQREHEAMRALIVAYRAYDDHVAINRHECRFCGVGYERACDVAGRLERELEAALAAYDALSAPAAEPEVQP